MHAILRSSLLLALGLSSIRSARAATDAPSPLGHLHGSASLGAFTLARGELAAPDGNKGAAIVGAQWRATSGKELRVAAVVAGPIPKYRVEVIDGARPTALCADDGLAFALDGSWSPHDGDRLAGAGRFTFACAASAVGGCVDWGYVPWVTSSGTSLADFHQACVRMKRADYCGNGVALTKGGAAIDFSDTAGVRRSDATPGWLAEAEWSTDGAWCIRHTRWQRSDGAGPAPTDLAYIQAMCPSRLAANAGGASCKAPKKLLDSSVKP